MDEIGINKDVKYTGFFNTFQHVEKTIYDLNGNRFVLLKTNSDVLVDSAGITKRLKTHADTIPKLNSYSFLILKYSEKGHFLNFNRVDVFRANFNQFGNADLHLGNNNEVSILLNFFQTDSIHLFNASGKLIISINDAFKPNGGFSIFWQINSDGSSNFINQLHYEDGFSIQNSNTIANYSLRHITELSSTNFTLHIDKIKNTISNKVKFIDKNGLETYFNMATDLDIMVTKSGVYSSIKNVSFTKSGDENLSSSVLHRSQLSDGILTLIKLDLSNQDSLIGTSIPIDTGITFYLVKLNFTGTIMWANLIGQGKEIISFSIDFNSKQNNIMLGYGFDQTSFHPTNQPNLSQYNSILISLNKINANTGSNSWSKFIGTNYPLHFYTWNSDKKNSGSYLLGKMFGPNLSIDTYTHNSDGSSRPYLLYFDSLNQVKESASILSTPSNLLSLSQAERYNIATNTQSNYLIGNTGKVCFIDKNGHFTIYGSFADSLNLGCNTYLLRNVEPNHKIDGFELFFRASSQAIDTTICYKTLSPSGKQIWNSSGLYYDTIQMPNGCNKPLIYNVSIANNNGLIQLSNPITCDKPISKIENSYNGSFYQWTPNDFLDNPISKNPTVKNPLNSITYKLTVTDSNGCVTIDSISIFSDLYGDSIGEIPNVITPNKDGNNDCFESKSWGVWNHVTFSVYNRWGTLVYSKNSNEFCWDGTTNSGENLDDGVYYYVLEGTLGCIENYTYQGIIHIIR